MCRIEPLHEGFNPHEHWELRTILIGRGHSLRPINTAQVNSLVGVGDYVQAP